MKTIVVAIDGSEHSRRALNQAAEIAKAFNAKVHVISVYDVSKSKNLFNAEKTIDNQAEMTSDAVALVQRSRRFLTDEGIDNDGMALEGSASERIVEYADEHNADMIIMGQRGVTGLRRLMGSVTSKVLNSTEVSVLVVQ
ncbi:MAG: universal stress protein [Saccharofermentanales bacterium]|jgi:nucleotide-binding universal stress UspA family protein